MRSIFIGMVYADSIICNCHLLWMNFNCNCLFILYSDRVHKPRIHFGVKWNRFFIGSTFYYRYVFRRLEINAEQTRSCASTNSGRAYESHVCNSIQFMHDNTAIKCKLNFCLEVFARFIRFLLDGSSVSSMVFFFLLPFSLLMFHLVRKAKKNIDER